MSLTGARLSGGCPSRPRVSNDFYATNPETVKTFLKAFNATHLIHKDMVFWECACGNGNISKVLEKFYPYNTIVSTDLVDRGYGATEDFLTSTRRADFIITNPPFAQLNAFIEHGLKQTNRYLILFAKLQLLETKSRADLLKNSPLKEVWVHSERQATWRDGNPLDEHGKKWTTTICMAWFIWDKEYKGEPVIRFL